MTAENKIIDLSHYDGPTTVVGYPDLSAIKNSLVAENRETAQVFQQPPKQEGNKHHHHRKNH